MADAMRGHGWYAVVSSETITFRKSLNTWQRFDVVDRARAQFKVPVTHVVAKSLAGRQVPK